MSPEFGLWLVLKYLITNFKLAQSYILLQYELWLLVTNFKIPDSFCLISSVLSLTKPLNMKNIFLNITIWILIFLNFYFASSSETITSSLFRKIPIQEFRTVGVGYGGRTELQTSRIVNII